MNHILSQESIVFLTAVMRKLNNYPRDILQVFYVHMHILLEAKDLITVLFPVPSGIPLVV